MELFGFGAGITEHDTLVSRSLLLFGLAHNALVDVGRLFVDGREHAARLPSNWYSLRV